VAQVLKSTSQDSRGILFEASTSQGSGHRTYQPSSLNLPQPGFHSHDSLEFHCLASDLPATTWGSVFSNGDDRQVGVSNDSESASNWAVNCHHATGTSPFSAATPVIRLPYPSKGFVQETPPSDNHAPSLHGPMDSPALRTSYESSIPQIWGQAVYCLNSDLDIVASRHSINQPGGRVASTKMASRAGSPYQRPVNQSTTISSRVYGSKLDLYTPLKMPVLIGQIFDFCTDSRVIRMPADQVLGAGSCILPQHKISSPSMPHLSSGQPASTSFILQDLPDSTPLAPAPLKHPQLERTKPTRASVSRTKRADLAPSYYDQRNRLQIPCQWDICAVECQGLDGFKTHLQLVHNLPIGHSGKGFLPCKWRGCTQWHDVKRGDLRRHLVGTLRIRFACHNCSLHLPRDEESEMRKHLSSCYGNHQHLPSDVAWDEVRTH